MYERVKLAQLITEIQNAPEKMEELLKTDWIPKTRAHIVGITGSTAIGKSTLINKLIKILREDKLSVIVLAIDPTEETSGGAVLGDAIRMREHYLDDRVFIRSLGSRGARSALTHSLQEITEAVSRFADMVIVETAGAGQSDIDVKSCVDTLVVLPESRGDIVNLLKAGPHQHAHILAVNIHGEEDKKFLAPLQQFAKAIASEDWHPLVFGVNAHTGEGVEKLVREGIYKHKDFLKSKSKKSP